MKTHKEVCKGRPWDSFVCDQCSLNFSVASDLKQHVVKVHDPAKLLYCLQELYKPIVKNFKCNDCDTKFEFDSELELHELTSHGIYLSTVSIVEGLQEAFRLFSCREESS